MKLLGGMWSRGDVLALTGVIVAILATILAIPGMPKHLGIDLESWSKTEPSPGQRAKETTTPTHLSPAQEPSNVPSREAKPLQTQSASFYKVKIIRSRDLHAGDFVLDTQPIPISAIVEDALSYTTLQLQAGSHTLSIPRAIRPCPVTFSVPSAEPISLTCDVPFERNYDGKDDK
jgi:hypothetical protein